MDMISQDFQENPKAPYNEDPALVDAVNKVAKSGEPLRRKSSMTAEEQRAADKKAYMEMMLKRKGWK